MLEVELSINAKDTDLLCEELEMLGVSAITCLDETNQPIYEPLPGEIIYWQKMKLIILLETKELLPQVVSLLDAKKVTNEISPYQIKNVIEKDWIKDSLDQFKPIQFGKRLWICPSWQTPPCPDAINVILDPGLAFGTGTHPTTAMCLKWLDENIKGGETIIDYGCGSGILAVAALKLGAQKVVAVDHHPQALIACRANSERNDIHPDRLSCFHPDDFPPIKADILIANILANPIKLLLNRFAESLIANGKIALSGILEDQMDDVIKTYNLTFNLSLTKKTAEWILISGTKRM